MDIIISLLITAVFYLSVPVIVAIVLSKKDKLLTRGIRIGVCVGWAVLVSLGFGALTFSQGYGVNTTPAFIWGIVSYLVMPKVWEHTSSTR